MDRDAAAVARSDVHAAFAVDGAPWFKVGAARLSACVCARAARACVRLVGAAIASLLLSRPRAVLNLDNPLSPLPPLSPPRAQAPGAVIEQPDAAWAYGAEQPLPPAGRV